MKMQKKNAYCSNSTSLSGVFSYLFKIDLISLKTFKNYKSLQKLLVMMLLFIYTYNRTPKTFFMFD